MRKLVFIIVAICVLAGCKSTPNVASVVGPYTYKIDLQQGNVVTQDMVAKLRQGMTQTQVRYVLGSPLVTDSFHPDRWDYIYLYEKGHKVTERHQLTVIFADGKLASLEGQVQLQDLSPSEQTSGTSTPVTAPVASVLAPQESGQSSAAAPVAAVPAVVPTTSTPTTPAQGGAPLADTNAAAPSKPDVATQPQSDPNASTATTPAAPAADADVAKSDDSSKAKQRGFFGRMLDKIGL